ncbi:chromate efflux transporter [Gloeomargarita lithophora]|nr:chromate efflux transporter [Gloeomargarita lithophora]
MTQRLVELAQVFARLGGLAFGGPAAHIALIQKEVVEERQWLSAAEFLDLMGATNLIPGPNSTEMAILVGLRRAGGAGLVVAGVCFILPAALITTLIAWGYRELGTLPQVAPLLVGIQPVTVMLIVQAGWRLGQKAVKSRLLLGVGLGVILLAILGVGEVLALLAGGILGVLVRRPPQPAQGAWWPGLGLPLVMTATPVPEIPPSLGLLGLFFLKVGAVLFGGGYLLVAFIENDLVNGYGWLTQQQLLDAIAVGQFTPGPVLSTASFIGFQISGWSGAAVSTVAIFLPSFFFVLLLNPILVWFRRTPWTGAFLDGLNVGAVALIGVVAVRLGWQIGVTPFAVSLWQGVWVVGIGILSGILLFWKRVSAPWLIGLGAILGVLGYGLGVINPTLS